jgi:membrane-bound lytic murein transglycosylase F
MHIRILLFIILTLLACKQKDPETLVNQPPQENSFSDDTLHVATLYGPSSYFIFGDEILGEDAELIQEYADFAERPVRFHVCKSESEMLKKLDEGQVDLIACKIFQTNNLKEKYAFVHHYSLTYPVLVQQTGFNTISEVSELKGKKVHVIKGSINELRIRNLNKELGGGIEIVSLNDTITDDKLIEKVIKKEIDYAVTDRKLAETYKEANRKLNSRVAVGFTQRSGWLTGKSNAELVKSITEWENLPETETLISVLNEKYLYRNSYFSRVKVKIPKGSISPYDGFFKKYSAEILWDWRLLASIAFHESGFDTTRVSYMGASGLMQLMPRTAANFGLSRSNIFNAEKNIEAGVEYIKSLNLLFRKIENKDERIKFILASYNSGPAHILDARALAKKFGKNPDIWFDNVEYYLAKKNEPEIYRDEVVKYGYFRAGTTIKYVKNILSTYYKYKGGA